MMLEDDSLDHVSLVSFDLSRTRPWTVGPEYSSTFLSGPWRHGTHGRRENLRCTSLCCILYTCQADLRSYRPKAPTKSSFFKTFYRLVMAGWTDWSRHGVRSGSLGSVQLCTWANPMFRMSACSPTLSTRCVWNVAASRMGKRTEKAWLIDTTTHPKLHHGHLKNIHLTHLPRIVLQFIQFLQSFP